MRNTPQSRFRARFLLFVCLAFFAAGLTLAPATAIAQEQAQLAAGQSTSARAPSDQANGPSAQPPHAKREEPEDENVYRHTALVQKLANLFHLDVETTARLFEFINFAIVALAIIIPVARFLPRAFRKRTTTLSHNLEVARKTTADANARLSAVEAQLARLDEEIGKIRAQVEEESKQDEARIKATIEEESARIVAAAEQEIHAAAAHARRGLRHFAADLAIEQAARQLALTPETDRALIAEFMSEAQNGAAGSATRGGQK